MEQKKLSTIKWHRMTDTIPENNGLHPTNFEGKYPRDLIRYHPEGKDDNDKICHYYNGQFGWFDYEWMEFHPFGKDFIEDGWWCELPEFPEDSFRKVDLNNE